MLSCENQKYLKPETKIEEEYLKKRGYKPLVGVNYGWWEYPFKVN